jgi:carnitine 3-dehydrogenase
VLDAVGLGQNYRKSNDYSTYTVESHLRYLREAKANDQITIISSIKDGDQKRLFTHHEMKRGDELIATCEFVCLHVDIRIPKTAPFPEAIFNNIQQLKT